MQAPFPRAPLNDTSLSRMFPNDKFSPLVLTKSQVEGKQWFHKETYVAVLVLKYALYPLQLLMPWTDSAADYLTIDDRLSRHPEVKVGGRISVVRYRELWTSSPP